TGGGRIPRGRGVNPGGRGPGVVDLFPAGGYDIKTGKRSPARSGADLTRADGCAMTIASATDLVQLLRSHQLLEAAATAEALRDLQARFPEPRALARELIQRGWLTAYQINQLFQGKGNELVFGSYVLLERLGEGAS